MDDEVSAAVELWKASWLRDEEEAKQRRLERDANAEQTRDLRLQNAEKRQLDRLTRVANALKVYEPRALYFWLRHDNWTVDEAMLLLCGVDPQSANGSTLLRTDTFAEENRQSVFKIKALDGVVLNGGELMSLVGTLKARWMFTNTQEKYRSIKKLWESGDHSEGRYQPRYFIDWAIRKGVWIKWIDWATENNLVDSIESASRLIVAGKMSPAVEYPWGTHSTELLTHLAAAAHRFWGKDFYDPAIPDSAPTNDAVEKWLIERGVTRRTAEVIATILRKDGLKLGRRN